MPVYYLNDFLDDCGLYCLDYFDFNTFRKVKNYISNEIDTSEWECGDFIRVPTSNDCPDEWYNMEGLYVWDGNDIIFPFFNGTCNDSDSVERRKVDDLIYSNGFMPNNLCAFQDYDPNDVFYRENGLSCKIGFANLYSDYNEICDNIVTINGLSSSYDSDLTISIAKFGYDRYVVFFGSLDYNIKSHLKNCRPYDFDINRVISMYDINISEDSIREAVGASCSDHLLFIQPNFLDVDYDCSSSSDNDDYMRRNRNVDCYITSTSPDYEEEPEEEYCCHITKYGDRCSRRAKRDGMCGIHLKRRRRRSYD